MDNSVTSALALALVLVLAGCTGPLVEFESSPATIPAAEHESAGYDHATTTEVPVTYPVGPPGLGVNVTARTWMSAYVRSTAENDTAALVLYSSPNVEVAGTSVNPLAQFSNRELVGFVLERISDLRAVGGVAGVTDLRQIGVRNVTMLGTTTQLVRYGGTAEVDGRSVDVVVNVAVVEHGDDVVVAIGVHEASLDETPTQAALVEAVVHES